MSGKSVLPLLTAERILDSVMSAGYGPLTTLAMPTAMPLILQHPLTELRRASFTAFFPRNKAP